MQDTATVELDSIATEMLAIPSKSSRNKNYSDPIDGKTTPIYCIMGIISIANSDDSDHFSLLLSRQLGRHYQIRLYSTELQNFSVHMTIGYQLITYISESLKSSIGNENGYEIARSVTQLINCIEYCSIALRISQGVVQFFLK